MNSSIIMTRIKKELLFVLLVVIVVVTAIPLFFMFSTSLKPEAELVLTNFSWFPKQWAFRNYIDAFSYGNWPRYYFNSAFITLTCVVGSLFFNSLAGFSFARLRFKMKTILFYLFLLGMMVPYQSIIIPQFIIIKGIPLAGGNNILGQGGIGWLNTYMALIVPFLSGSFGIFLCRQFYLSFPKALDDAAKIDGCSPFMTYLKIYLPLGKPVLASLAILKSNNVWNNFFYPLIMTTSNDMRTVQIALQQFQGEYVIQWNLLLAATLVSIIPILIVFFSAQKYFVSGIVTSGIK